MAVDRVDVVAQPHARVGDLDAARARPARRAARPAARRRAGAIRCSRPRKPAGSVCRRPSIQPATSPWSWLPAGDHSSPSGPSARPRSANTGAAISAASRCGASRSSSAVAEDHEPVDAARRASSSGARSSARRSRSARRASRGGGRRRRACASGRETSGPADDRPPARSTACSSPTSRACSRARSRRCARRPRGRRGQGRAPRRRRRHARLGAAVARRATRTYYLGLNRNKRSVALDLADEGDRALARALGERADVLIECFRPGLMASWGLDGDALRERNPRLVSCSVTAFGTRRARLRPARLRLPAAGDGRAHERHRRGRRARR